MTLVIAGYSRGGFEEGIYFAADSHITQRNQILVKGFKKVIELPIRVKGLNFCGDWFNGYLGNRYESSCAIAFAGSSLVAQHLINSMKNHLSELYPTFSEGRYQIVMSCEQRKHLRNNDNYSEDMFQDRDLDNILTGDYLSQVVCHSIEAVLNKAREHGSMSRLFVAYQAEFIFGVQCPQTREYQLYQYEIVPDEELGAKVEYLRIANDDLAVIGEKEKFKESAREALSQCPPEDKPSHAMFSFLNQSIDNENSIGNNGIGKPSGLFNLQGRMLTKVLHEN